MHVISVATRSLKGRSNNGQVATTATGGITVTALVTHLSERSGGASHVPHLGQVQESVLYVQHSSPIYRLKFKLCTCVSV